MTKSKLTTSLSPKFKGEGPVNISTVGSIFEGAGVTAEAADIRDYLINGDRQSANVATLKYFNDSVLMYYLSTGSDSIDDVHYALMLLDPTIDYRNECSIALDVETHRIILNPERIHQELNLFQKVNTPTGTLAYQVPDGVQACEYAEFIEVVRTLVSESGLISDMQGEIEELKSVLRFNGEHISLEVEHGVIIPALRSIHTSAAPNSVARGFANIAIGLLDVSSEIRTHRLDGVDDLEPLLSRVWHPNTTQDRAIALMSGLCVCAYDKDRNSLFKEWTHTRLLLSHKTSTIYMCKVATNYLRSAYDKSVRNQH